jgi:hypothetical protein
MDVHLPPWLRVGFPKVVPESSATGITSRGVETKQYGRQCHGRRNQSIDERHGTHEVWLMRSKTLVGDPSNAWHMVSRPKTNYRRLPSPSRQFG